MANLRYQTPVVVACTANATVYVLGGTCASGRPQTLDEIDLIFDRAAANDVAMVVEIASWDTQGTSGTDTDATFDDSRVTETPPDGQYNMTGSSTNIPNGNKVLRWIAQLAPSDKLLGHRLTTPEGGQIVIPAGKTWAVSVANPSGNSAPNATCVVRGRD